MENIKEFFTFFSNIVVGYEENDKTSMEEALSTIKSSNVMESIQVSLTEEISNYENKTIQEVSTEQTVEIDCGSYRLDDWHLKEMDKKSTWYGEDIPYSGCIQYGCCYDVYQTSDIKLYSNNEIKKVKQEEIYNSITQKLKNEVELVVGDDDKPLKILDAAINRSKNYCVRLIETHINNMNSVSVKNKQKIVIKSLSPLLCKSNCNERPTAGTIKQYINLEIATDNIITDVLKTISENFVSMVTIKKSKISTVNTKKLYLFSGFSVLLIVTIYILCYLLGYFLYLAILKKPPSSQYITHFIACILLLIIYLFLGMIICIIRSGGGLKMLFCMF